MVVIYFFFLQNPFIKTRFHISLMCRSYQWAIYISFLPSKTNRGYSTPQPCGWFGQWTWGLFIVVRFFQLSFWSHRFLQFSVFLNKKRDYHSYQWMLLLLVFFYFVLFYFVCVAVKKEEEETSPQKNIKVFITNGPEFFQHSHLSF